MAYVAAVALNLVIDQFYYFSDQFPNIQDLLPFIDCLKQIVVSLLSFDFKILNSRDESGKSLEKEIRDTLQKTEEMLASYLSTHFLSLESEIQENTITTHPSNFSQHLLQLVQEIGSNIERMVIFASDEVLNHGDTVFRGPDINSSRHGFPAQSQPNKLVGLDGELKDLKKLVMFGGSRHLGAALIYGMGGIGKTSLAQTFYNDCDVGDHFIIGAWVKISLEHFVRGILLDLCYTMEAFGRGRLIAETNYGLIQGSDDEGLEIFVRRMLTDHRYLVVVDCLCDINNSSWDYIKGLLPDSNNGSRIILANRLVFEDEEFVFLCYRKRFLDSKTGWNLLREQVFGDEPCPSITLERIGKRIAMNCQGLPLAIITTGFHLAKRDKTAEYWNKVADSGNAIVYAADGAAMFEQLGLSYKQMPQCFKPVYLYMGAFPESCEIPQIEFQNLLASEGFVGHEKYTISCDVSAGWPEYFLRRHLVNLVKSEFGLPSCSLHHAMWHFCCNQAMREEFFYVMDKFINDQEYPNIRRLVIRKNVFLGVCKLETSLLSTIHSLLLTGPYHPYPLNISSGSYKKLRVLNARSTRFFCFPTEILYLKLLSYLALTLNGRGSLPPDISKMRNLRFLIVRMHQMVKSLGEGPTYLPMEIWEMQQLIHLEVEGNDLPAPSHQSDLLLPTLMTLTDVSPHSCTKEVFERIPNLTNLRISINIPPEIDVASPLNPFDHLILLHKLNALTCKITNPYFKSHLALPHLISMPKGLLVSVDHLTVLTLSGCGFSWEVINQISQLPVLEDLSLKCHAFRGPKWEVTKDGFKRLHSLLLEDLDLIYWTAMAEDPQFFPCLDILIIRRCHKLQELPLDLVHCGRFLKIEIADCSAAVETWARSIQMEMSPIYGFDLVITSPRGGASAGTNC